MGYALLTGATGLLGQYLLRDLLLRDETVVVLARSSPFAAARHRINAFLSREEARLGRPLARPIVIEGDLTIPGLAANEKDAIRLREICSKVIHSAASIAFYRTKTDEPFRTNIDGTNNLLRFCDGAGIEEFHHISTAYVCGNRRGRIMERDLSDESGFGNDYERTKFVSESVVREAAFRSLTVYRPSIIVGDSASGFTSTYHGFYTPIQLGVTLVAMRGYRPDGSTMLREKLELRGDERKNLVPVDWVSSAFVEIYRNPANHGRTYHLTNPFPVKTSLLEKVASDIAVESLAGRSAPNLPIDDQGGSEFRTGMDAYRSYFRDDPEFDDTNTRSATTTACPVLDYGTLMKLARFALRAGFGWPRPPLILPSMDCETLVAELLTAETRDSNAVPRAALLGIEVSGPGGGVWEVAFPSTSEDLRPTWVARGIQESHVASVYLSSDTFRTLMDGELTVSDAIRTGRIVIFGTETTSRSTRVMLAGFIRYVSEQNRKGTENSIDHTSPLPARRREVLA